MLITLALPWTGPDGESLGAGVTTEVDDDTAGQLIRDGRARAAGIAGLEIPAGQAEGSAGETPLPSPLRKADQRRPSAHSTPDSPATGANSEGVS